MVDPHLREDDILNAIDIGTTMNMAYEAEELGIPMAEQMDLLAIDAAVSSLKTTFDELRTTERPWRSNDWYSDDCDVCDLQEFIDEQVAHLGDYRPHLSQVEIVENILAAAAMLLVREKLIESQIAERGTEEYR